MCLTEASSHSDNDVRYRSPIGFTSTETRPISSQTQITRSQILPQNTHQPMSMPMPIPQYGFQVNSSTCPYPTSGQPQFTPYPVNQRQSSAPYPTQQYPASAPYPTQNTSMPYPVQQNDDQAASFGSMLTSHIGPYPITWRSFESRSLLHSQARNSTRLSDTQSRSQQPSVPSPIIEQPSAPHQTTISVQDNDPPFVR